MTLGLLARRYLLGRPRLERWVVTSFSRSVGFARRPAKITRRHVERFLEEIDAPESKQAALWILRSVFDMALVRGYVSANPTDGIVAGIGSIKCPTISSGPSSSTLRAGGSRRSTLG